MRPLALARASLLLLWWGTVAASLHDGGAAGVALLRQATGLGPKAALAVVLLGCAWDAGIGLWLALKPSATACRAAACGVIGMTLLATVLLPQLWLDPFGPLLKNLPVLALLGLLSTASPQERQP